MYIHFTPEQKESAKSTDLVQFLTSQGEKLKRSGSEWEWIYGGAKVTIRGNKWFHQYDREGGTAIDFVQRFYNKDYPEAVLMLLGTTTGTLSAVPPEPRKIVPFALPEANGNMHRVFAYLLQKRFIDRDVVSCFAHEHLIYECKEFHNAVFVGMDEQGVPRHAHKRGTYSDSTYKGNVDGSDPRYSFHRIGTGDTFCIFEAPIDMLSYITLNKDNWQESSYVALCCVSPIAALHMLKQNPHLRKIRLCLDHDRAGIEACYRITEQLLETGYTDIQFSQPDGLKDWNETLKAQNGQEALPAVEHSGINAMRELCGHLLADIRHERLPFNPLGKLMDAAEQLGREKNNLKFVTAQSYDIAILTLLYAKDRYRQLHIPLTAEQLGNKLFSFYQPHKDNVSLRNKMRGLFTSLYCLKEEQNSGLLTKTQMEERINNILKVCIDSL